VTQPTGTADAAEHRLVPATEPAVVAPTGTADSLERQSTDELDRLPKPNAER
jgi:hypothetical protein